MQQQPKSRAGRSSTIVPFILAALFVALGLTTVALSVHASSASAASAPASTHNVNPGTYSGATMVFTSIVPVSSATAAAAPPAAVATSQSAPQPVPSGQAPQAVPTGNAAPAGNTGNPNAPSDVPGAASNPPAQSQFGGFPWLPVAILAAVVLAAIAFLLLRPRRAVTAEGAVAAPGVAATGARVAPVATSTTTTTTARAGTAPVAVASAVAAPATPATVQCPNCQTSNDFKEDFCRECGEDLRPTKAALVAAATPPPEPEVVTDDMPYLETLDRVDEQLEYVLSRRRVLIGTGANNDIVVDAAFRGWKSVSPVHAELRREQDGFVLIDRESENGTFVNDQRTGESILTDGDQLRVGDVRFVYHVPEVEQ